MTVEEMKKKKTELGFSCEQISDRSGVPLGTVQKIFSGITKRPRYDTICQLEKAFPMEHIIFTDNLGRDCKASGNMISPEYMKEPDSNPYPGMMEESVSAYRIYGDGTDHEGDIWKSFRGKKQGEYTLKDYEAIPDEYRVELIDGVIYDLNTPTTIHQQLAFEISIRLREYIRQNKGLCMVLPSPVSVQLDEDDRTMLQPDVVVCCVRDKILRSHVYGAPDMVIEILSPSTRKKDMGLKLKKYITARVREYWMVDPDKKKVVVYDLEHNELPAIYGFEDQVPVNIFAGKCQIDFSEIYSYIEFLFEKE